jgi:hypothetical protein
MAELRPTTIERAFQVARTGAVATLQEISFHLHREGYLDVNHQLNGPLIRKQLRAILRSSQSNAEAERA